MDFQEIKRTEIDPKKIGSFTSEDNFNAVSVALLVEVGSFVCFAGNLYQSGTYTWNREQAIIGGHLVRLYKLTSALLDQTCQRRRETSFVFGRLAFECIINMRFLIKHASKELFRSYQAYSLKHEKKLKVRIEENIEKRKGTVLPIEERMLNSINKTFEVSGISPEDIIPSQLKTWGGKNLYDKANDLGLATAYLAAIGGASHSVHGNWQDLLEYHIEHTENDHFRPAFDWHIPRPQLLNAISLHATAATRDYLRWIARDRTDQMDEVLRELQDRILLLDKLHEQFLTNGSNQE